MFKFEEGKNFNHSNTLSISRINPPKFGGGLKFEPDTDIGQKGMSCKGFFLKAVIIDIIIVTAFVIYQVMLYE